MRKNKVKIFIGIISALVLIVCIAAITIVLGIRSLDQYKAQLEKANAELAENQKTVYVASQDLLKGDTIDETTVMPQRIYTGLDSSAYISEEDLGSTAIVSISANMPVMESMVTPLEITSDERVYEMTVAHLMTTQANNDIVDVRIMFPNGEDYLVLSQKQVKDLQLGTSVFSTYLNEDEILRMSSAIVDAYTTTGARIYTVKYIESNLQDEAIPNYLVKPAVIDLINSDPNILDQAEMTLNLQARNDLDARLGAISEDQLKAVAEGLSLDDTAKTSVIREGTYSASSAQESDTESDEMSEESDDSDNTSVSDDDSDSMLESDLNINETE